MDWINEAHDSYVQVTLFQEHGNEPSGSVKCAAYLD
jgi:hypothetical protein